MVFDLGAQAERVRAANFGFCSYELIDDIRGLNDRLCELPYADAFFDRRRFDCKAYEDVLMDYYALNDAFGRSSAPCTALPDHSALSASDVGIDPS